MTNKYKGFYIVVQPPLFEGGVYQATFDGKDVPSNVGFGYTEIGAIENLTIDYNFTCNVEAMFNKTESVRV